MVLGTEMISQGKTRRSFKLDWKSVLKKRIPITSWLPNYGISTFLQDLLAGFTVGLTEIPQAIAYAGVAGLSPEYGLYSGLTDGITYAIFGSCKDVNIGPTSIMSLMLQPHVTKMGPGASILITFLSGVIIFILGLLHLGFVVEFFSYPIIAGFMCAASLQIASSQIKSLLGIPGKADVFLDAWTIVFKNLNQISLWDTVLGVVSLIILVAMREIRKYGTLQLRPDWSRRRNIIGICIFMLSLARNALVVIFGTVLAYCLQDPPFKLTGKVHAGFPDVRPPEFSTSYNGQDFTFEDMAQNYGSSIAFIPIVAILEAISIAKAFAKGKKLDATQEMLALGLCNIFGSFFHSMPVTGSFTRSAVNNASGVKTQFAGIFTSIMLVLAIAFLTPTFAYVPKATLASVVIGAMFYLFDFKAFAVIWRTKKLDMVPFLTTLLTCLFYSLEYGILIGIAVNLIFVLYASARPKLNLITEKIPSHQGDVTVITPCDTLYFPAAEYLRDTILELEGNNLTIVIDGKYIRNIDVTVAKSMVTVVKEMEEKDSRVIFLNFKKSIINVCVNVSGRIGENFKTGSLEQCIDSI